MADEKPIWQRLEDETAKAFDAFCVYRNLGADRSIDKAYQHHQNTTKTAPKHWSEWSVKYNWVERAAKYDEWLADEHSREVVKRQALVQTNEWNDYLAIRKGVMKRIRAFDAVDWANPPSDHINALVSLMKEAADIGRRSVGLPEKITENKQKLSGSVTWEQIVTEAREDIDEQDPFA